MCKRRIKEDFGSLVNYGNWHESLTLESRRDLRRVHVYRPVTTKGVFDVRETGSDRFVRSIQTREPEV